MHWRRQRKRSVTFYSSSIYIENRVAAVENDKIRFLTGGEH